jgi:exosortase/archaeosortase family protein
MEGISFFIMTGILIVMAKHKEFGFKNSFLFLLLGTIGMYWLNVMRLTLLQLCAIALTKIMGVEAAYPIIQSTLHVSVGWLTYGVGLLLYLFAWKKWVLDPRLTESILVNKMHTQEA